MESRDHNGAVDDRRARTFGDASRAGNAFQMAIEEAQGRGAGPLPRPAAVPLASLQMRDLKVR
jgi:hypothetical protein